MSSDDKPIPSITLQLQAIDTMLKALDGEEVNGAYLASPGACKYLIEEDGYCQTCIVGSLLTKQGREHVKRIGMNMNGIFGLLNSTGQGAELASPLLTALDTAFLDRLQNIFDARGSTPGEEDYDWRNKQEVLDRLRERITEARAQLTTD